MNKFIILADYYHIIEEEIKKIIDNNPEVIYFDAETLELDELIVELGSLTLFSTKKIVVLRNFNLYKNMEKLEKFLLEFDDEDNLDFSLILTSMKSLDGRRKTTAFFKEKYKIIDCLNKQDHFYLDRLNNIIEKNEYKINHNDLKMFFSRVINNYDIGINELNKLFLANIKTKVITKESIETHIPKYIIDEIFTIKNGIVKKKPEEYIDLLEDYKNAKKSIFPLISLLVNDYRYMYVVKNSDYSDEAIQKKFEINSSYPIKLARENSYNYTSEELLDKIVMLAELDYQVKSGKIEEYIGFDLFLLEIKGDYNE